MVKYYALCSSSTAWRMRASTFSRPMISMLSNSGGLILCPGCDAPINTKPENMAAFVAAAREYGKIA